MHARIFGVVEFQKRYRFINIFGHGGHGIPGISFTGGGPFLKVLKEKILYLIKDKGLTIPLRKYSITIELPSFLQSGAAGREEHLLNLELPILVIFLQLSENIRIKNLERCFCAGQVKINGTISSWRPSPQFLENIELKAGRRACYLALDDKIPSRITRISLRKVNPRLFC